MGLGGRYWPKYEAQWVQLSVSYNEKAATEIIYTSSRVRPYTDPLRSRQLSRTAAGTQNTGKIGRRMLL